MFEATHLEKVLASPPWNWGFCSTNANGTASWAKRDGVKQKIDISDDANANRTVFFILN